MTLFLGFVVGFVGVWIGIWGVRWRRRRREPSALTPRWLNEHVYNDRSGDEP